MLCELLVVDAALFYCDCMPGNQKHTCRSTAAKSGIKFIKKCPKNRVSPKLEASRFGSHTKSPTGSQDTQNRTTYLINSLGFPPNFSIIFFQSIPPYIQYTFIYSTIHFSFFSINTPLSLLSFVIFDLISLHNHPLCLATRRQLQHEKIEIFFLDIDL